MVHPKTYWVGFNLVKGIGAARLRGLLQRFGDVQTAWSAPAQDLRSAGLGPKLVETFQQVRASVSLEQVWERIDHQNIQVITWDDEAYPSRLKEIDQPPPVLYVRGSLLPEDEWAVGADVVCGAHHAYFDTAATPGVVEQIRASEADILLVALGAPRQDQWLAAHLAATGAKVGICVGGLFDFYSGRIPRAPVWMLELGLEWVFRFYQEPRRMWRRYLIGNVQFVMRVLRERWGLAARALE